MNGAMSVILSQEQYNTMIAEIDSLRSENTKLKARMEKLDAFMLRIVTSKSHMDAMNLAKEAWLDTRVTAISRLLRQLVI